MQKIHADQLWLPVKSDHDFSIYNLPYGIFSTNGKGKRVGVRIGDFVIDLYEFTLQHLGNTEMMAASDVFKQEVLNNFIRKGKAFHLSVRKILQESLLKGSKLESHHKREQIVIPVEACELHLPLHIGDYTDFYSSMEHATNVGSMFRDPNNALLPNWKHLPVGYHGRSSSIVVSGTPIKRPKGQYKLPDQTEPVFGPSQQLDFELETAFVVGADTDLGTSISTAQAEEYIFGMVLFNDWSARDIQSWEYQPLGPFLGKNFGSSISPWVVTLEALEYFKVEGPIQFPQVLPYLQFKGKKSYDINLEVYLKTRSGQEKLICSSNHKYLYWNMAQQLAHHTVNGCNVRVGDVYASGTISGPTADSFGSMLELTWKGSKPITIAEGETRTFIQDYDTITIKGYCVKGDIRVGFGEVSGTILPA
jgi:fumarylacetoacetase